MIGSTRNVFTEIAHCSCIWDSMAMRKTQNIGPRPIRLRACRKRSVYIQTVSLSNGTALTHSSIIICSWSVTQQSKHAKWTIWYNIIMPDIVLIITLCGTALCSKNGLRSKRCYTLSYQKYSFHAINITWNELSAVTATPPYPVFSSFMFLSSVLQKIFLLQLF